MHSVLSIAVILFNLSVYRAEVDEKSIFAPKITLSDKYEIPVVGLGTSQAKSSVGEQAVKSAISIGYRHFDTAWVYENEKDVGNAIRVKINENVIKREDVFVTTKLWGTFHEPDQVPRAFQKSMDNLNISYIDLYLMHAPFAYQRISKTTNRSTENIEDVVSFPRGEDGKSLSIDIDYIETWKAMENLMKTGKVRSLGVSNFNSQQLDRLLKSAVIKPVVNQVECHPNLNQRKLIEFSKERNITTICYSPLGRPHNAGDKKIALKDAKVQQIAEKYKKNAGQILLRFSYQNGAIVIPKSTNEQRLRSNIDIFDFNLENDEMEYLNSLDNNLRLITFADDKDNKYYPFNLPF